MIPRDRLPGLLLLAALMVPGAARSEAPEGTAGAAGSGAEETPADAGNGPADAAGPGDPAPPSGEVPAETAGGEPENATGPEREPDDVFVPTEKVSEDLSVPFPVDI